MCLLPPSSTLFPYTTLFRSLFEGVAQGFILGVLDRVETREHHRFGVPVAGEGLDRRPRGFRERLAHLRVRPPLDSSDDVADLSRRQPLDGPHVWREDADLLDVGRAAVR